MANSLIFKTWQVLTSKFKLHPLFCVEFIADLSPILFRYIVLIS